MTLDWSLPELEPPGAPAGSGLKQWQAEREQALNEARETTAERVRAGKAEIEQSVADARRQIETVSMELSEQILRAVMPAETRAEVAQ